MSPPPHANHYSPNSSRYDDRYSPDSRYNDYPDDMASSYASETDLSPPRSPEPYYRGRNHRNHDRNHGRDEEDDYGSDTPSPRSPPAHSDSRRRKPNNKGSSTSSSSGDCYDDW